MDFPTDFKLTVLPTHYKRTEPGHAGQKSEMTGPSKHVLKSCLLVLDIDGHLKLFNIISVPLLST